MSSLKGDKMPCARLCHIVKWDDFDGYGFNLHAEKGKNGQFIGKVDDGSPSQAAGLRQGDRIIEVNEINIANESHKQVVERIKAFANETKLLVVDLEADEYFRANNIIIKGTMANVKVIKTPEKNPYSAENDEERSPEGANTSYTQEYEEKKAASTETPDNGCNITTADVSTTSIGAIGATAATAVTAPSSSLLGTSPMTMTTMTTMTTTTTTTTSTSTVNEKSGDESGGQLKNMGWETGRENGNGFRSNEAAAQHATGNGVGGSSASGSIRTGASSDMGVGAADAAGSHTDSKQQSLNLKMSAKELRAQLAARKKYDPKKESIGFKDKFDIVQKL